MLLTTRENHELQKKSHKETLVPRSDKCGIVQGASLIGTAPPQKGSLVGTMPLRI